MRLNFVTRASKVGKNGLSPLELSIIVNGERKVITLDKRVDPKKWDASKQRVKGDKVTNAFIEAVSQQFMTIEVEFIKRGITPTLSQIIDVFKNGWKEDVTTLLSFYSEWLKQYREDPTVSIVQYNKYVKTLEYLTNYCKGVDKNLKDITPSFVEGFYGYLLSNGNKTNTAIQKMKQFKHILQVAVEERLIDKTPFKIKLSKEKLEYTPLTVEELNIIKDKDFHIDRLNRVRDIALVMAYTGLAYADMASLSKEDITDGVIIKRRHKTDVQSTIPVLPIVEEILIKYDYQMPIPSNQKMNAYLKEIGDICGIKKELHCHLLRHTYATILLNSGIDMTTVSKCCGHSNTRITESIYAQMHTETIKKTVLSVADRLV